MVDCFIDGRAVPRTSLIPRAMGFGRPVRGVPSARYRAVLHTVEGQ